MLNICGLKGNPKTYKNSATYALIKECLNWFVENNYIEYLDKESIDAFDINELVRLQIIEEHFYLSYKGGDKVNEPFVKITKEEFDTLTSIKHRLIPRLMFTFLYIKSYCGYRYSGQLIKDYPICTWISQNKIAKHLNCSQAKISTYTDKLCEIELLKREKLSKTSEKQANYIYTLHTDNWKEELHYGKLKYQREQGE